MAVRNSIRAIPLTSFDTAGLTVAYKVLNAGGLPSACFLVRLINNSDRDITISLDGVTDYDFVPAHSSFQFSIQVNSQPNNYVALFPVGTKFYVSGAVLGTGSIYLAGYTSTF